MSIRIFLFTHIYIRYVHVHRLTSCRKTWVLKALVRTRNLSRARWRGEKMGGSSRSSSKRTMSPLDRYAVTRGPEKIAHKRRSMLISLLMIYLRVKFADYGARLTISLAARGNSPGFPLVEPAARATQLFTSSCYWHAKRDRSRAICPREFNQTFVQSTWSDCWGSKGSERRSALLWQL